MAEPRFLPAPDAETQRVSLRRRRDGGALSDVVGHLIAANDEWMVVLPEDRAEVWVPRGEVESVRKVPERVVLPASDADGLGVGGRQHRALGDGTDGAHLRARHPHGTAVLGQHDEPLVVGRDQVAHDVACRPGRGDAAKADAAGLGPRRGHDGGAPERHDA